MEFALTDFFDDHDKWCILSSFGLFMGASPSSRLEKKQTINSWKRHALCDSVLSHERNRWTRYKE